MNHLPTVSDPVRGSIIVPFVCAKLPFHSQPLSPEEFENTPQKHGTSTSDLLANASNHHDLSHSISILQSWLFFGLLVQVIGPVGVLLSQNEFLRTEADGSLVITTERLPKYLWFWLAVRHHQPRLETEEHAKLADSCLKVANKFLNNFIIALNTKNPHVGDSDASSIVDRSTAGRVLLSLVVLADQLCRAREEIVRYSVGPMLHWEYPSYGTALLRDAGWCAAEINSLYIRPFFSQSIGIERKKWRCTDLRKRIFQFPKLQAFLSLLFEHVG